MVAQEFLILSQLDISPEAWNGVLAHHARSPKLLYDWARSMAATYSRSGALRVVLAGTPRAPDALLALTVVPGPLRRHEFVANDDGGLPVPCRDVAALPAVAAGLIGLRVPVDLGYYPANDPFVGAVQAAARGKASVVLRPQTIPAAPWLDLDASWAEPMTHLRKNMRHSIRRSERRLRELGEVSVDFIEPAPGDVDALLDTAVAVEAKSWKDRTGTSLSHDDKQQAFFREYAKTSAAAGRLHIAFLRLDGAAIAMSIGELHDNIFWAYKIGYDETHAKLGPGALMQFYLTAHLAKRGVERIEFQGQLLEYKKKWTDKAVETVAIRIYPYNLRGMAAMGYDAARQIIKRFEARQEAAARKRPQTGASEKPA